MSLSLHFVSSAFKRRNQGSPPSYSICFITAFELRGPILIGFSAAGIVVSLCKTGQPVPQAADVLRTSFPGPSRRAAAGYSPITGRRAAAAGDAHNCERLYLGLRYGRLMARRCCSQRRRADVSAAEISRTSKLDSTRRRRRAWPRSAAIQAPRGARCFDTSLRRRETRLFFSPSCCESV